MNNSVKRRLVVFGIALLSPLLAVGCRYKLEELDGRTTPVAALAAVGDKGAPNAGIICTNLGVIVIDPPLNQELGQTLLLDAQRRSLAYWTAKNAAAPARSNTAAPPVLYVINTTFRGSHSFGNIAYYTDGRPQADIIATPRAAQRLLNDAGFMREELRNLFKVPGLGIEHAVGKPTLLVDGKMTIAADDENVVFQAMGDCVGEGDAVVWLEKRRILFAGDLVLAGFVPYPHGRTPTIRNWLAALRELEKLRPTKIVPGHGPVGGADLLVKQRGFLEALLAETQKAVAAGQSREQAAAAVQLPDEYQTWPYYREWLPGNVGLAYDDLQNVKTELRAGAATVAPPNIEPADPFRRK